MTYGVLGVDFCVRVSVVFIYRFLCDFLCVSYCLVVKETLDLQATFYIGYYIRSIYFFLVCNWFRYFLVAFGIDVPARTRCWELEQVCETSAVFFLFLSRFR